MRKQRILLILFPVAAVMTVGLVLVLSREREPEYKGKKLSEWVESYSTNSQTERVEASQAREAIRHIGAEAVPFLLKWLRYEPPPWKSTLSAELNERFNLSLQLGDEKKRLRAGAATVAFRVLGSQADGAVPELTRLLNDPNVARPTSWRVTLDRHATPYRAALILAGLGQAGLPALQTLLTNQQAEEELKYYAARDIIIYGAYGRASAYRALQQMLMSPEVNVRQQASNAIMNIDPQTLTPKSAF